MERAAGQGRSQGGGISVRSGEMTWGKTCVMEFFPKEMLFVMPCLKGLLSVDNHNILGWTRFLWKGEGAQQKHGERGQQTPEIYTHLEQGLSQLKRGLAQGTWAQSGF